MQSRAVSVLVLLAIAFLGAAGQRTAGDYTPDENVRQEDYEGHMQSEHVIIMCVSFGLAGALLLWICAKVAWRRRVRLGMVIMTTTNMAVVTVGMVAWIITYQVMRKAIEEQVDSMLIARGSEVEMIVKSVLDIGPVINDLLEGFVVTGDSSLLRPFPDPLIFLGRLTHLFVSFHYSSVHMAYFTNAEGFMYSVIPSDNSVVYHVPFGRRFPPSFKCKSMVRPWEPASSNLCYSNDTGMAVNYKRSSWDHPVPVEPPMAISYDPTKRPWYDETPGHKWAAPYISHRLSEFYLTSTLAIHNTSTGAFLGIAAVDYTLNSLHPLFQSLGLTENSAVTLATTEGVIVASSISLPPSDDLQYVGNSTDRIRFPFEVLLNRFGSFKGAFESGKTMLYEGEWGILLQPVHVKGGLRLVVVISLPRDDVLGTSNKFSTLALLVVFAVSVAFCAVIAGLVTLILSPLRRLAHDMDKVALMQVDNIPPRGASVMAEVSWMHFSFQTMVTSLREYRKYLPQSILADNEANDDGVETPSESESSKEIIASSSISAQARTRLASSDLQLRKVSIVYSNMRHSHSTLSAGVVSFVSEFTTYIEAMVAVGKTLKGVIDAVVGDRVLVFFNTALHLLTHQVKAAQFPLRVRDIVAATSPRVRLTFGVCSGEARCGNIGCTGLKRHACFGVVVTCAGLLERLAGAWEKTILVDQAVYRGASDVVGLRALRKVIYPFPRTAALVYEAISEKQTPNEEWMYAVGGPDPYTFYNEAITAMVKGEYDKALQAARQCPEAESETLVARIEASRTTPELAVEPCFVAAEVEDLQDPRDEIPLGQIESP